jgi:hypothetical protein
LLDKSVTAGSDLDPRVLSAYVQQCKAEAQEVTIARAIELKHSPTLVSALANETSKLFLSAASAVKALDPTKVSKWMTYFQMKSSFYESYVRFFSTKVYHLMCFSLWCSSYCRTGLLFLRGKPFRTGKVWRSYPCARRERKVLRDFRQTLQRVQEIEGTGRCWQR